MPKQGYIKLYRDIQDHWLWLSEPFTKSQAWTDLLLSASFESGSFSVRGISINLKRGELARSEQYFCRRWQWSRSKVRNFFQMLESQKWIKWQKSNVINVIEIIDYDKSNKGAEVNLISLKKLLYDKGKELLKDHCKDSGALIGKWLSSYKQSIPVVLNCVLEAKAKAVENPISWIEARLKPKDTKKKKNEEEIEQKIISMQAIDKLTNNL